MGVGLWLLLETGISNEFSGAAAAAGLKHYWANETHICRELLLKEDCYV